MVIKIINDSATEKNESFRIRLNAATGARLGEPARAVVNIVDEDIGLAAPQFPIIFIHGIASSSKTWHDQDPAKKPTLGELLEKLGRRFGGTPTVNRATRQVDSDSVFSGPADFYALNFSDNQFLGFNDQGGELAKIIERVLQENPEKSKVILVAHSMGGLAAREYLQGLAILGHPTFIPYRGDVAKLITVGTPHKGTPLAVICQEIPTFCSLKEIAPLSIAVEELRPDSSAIERLNSLLVRDPDHELPSDVSYTSIVGECIHTNNKKCRHTFIGGERGDGIVSIDSQNLERLAGIGKLKLRHTHKVIPIPRRDDCGYENPPLLPRFAEVHTCEAQDAGVWAAILRAIRQ